jgi:D-alanine-D-alanine ligase-like ATP-grasp enzyme
VRLVHGERAVIVSKTRSPFLTQVAQSLANNKHLSRELLAGHGDADCVPDLLLDEGDDPRGPAVAAMLAAHGRLVVKPNWGNRGVGITTEVRTIERLVRARARARAIDLDEEVVVEPFVAGSNLRVAVIGGRFAAACEVQRPRIVGGRTTWRSRWRRSTPIRGGARGTRRACGRSIASSRRRTCWSTWRCSG